MKKLVTALLLSSMILSLCACGDSSSDQPTTCSHTYTQKMEKDPGCTTEGSILNTCIKCGESYSTTVPAAGHNHVDGVCTVCGEVE